jgi:hypothetical protein
LPLLQAVFLAAEWEAMMKALGRTEPPSDSGGVIFLVWGFLSGIAAISLYAAARPRFGPGGKTAVLTGFAFWVLTTVQRTIDDALVGLPVSAAPPRHSRARMPVSVRCGIGSRGLGLQGVGRKALALDGDACKQKRWT